MDKNDDNLIFKKLEDIENDFIEMSRHLDFEEFMILKRSIRSWNLDLSGKMEAAFLGKDKDNG